jgi:ABC-2 type transport system ATP-binding protein
MKAMVEVKDLKKRYGDKQAVDGISFEVKKGEIFGILGPKWRRQDNDA